MVAAWRDIWSDGDDIAKHALALMKNEWDLAGRSAQLALHGERERRERRSGVSRPLMRSP